MCVSRFFQRFVFVLALAIFSALGLGFAMGEFGLFGVHAGSDQDGAYRQMRVYAEVLKKVQTDYVTAPNINDVTTGALHGLLESLDSDSSYLTPTEYKIYKERPTTGVAQVGITVSKRFGYATVVNVLAGSPADKEHLSDGDMVDKNLHYEDLLKMVQQLPQAYRTVFNLFAIEGYSHEEIGAMLNINPGTSKSNLHKARQKLKQMILNADASAKPTRYNDGMNYAPIVAIKTIDVQGVFLNKGIRE